MTRWLMLAKIKLIYLLADSMTETAIEKYNSNIMADNIIVICDSAKYLQRMV